MTKAKKRSLTTARVTLETLEQSPNRAPSFLMGVGMVPSGVVRKGRPARSYEQRYLDVAKEPRTDDATRGRLSARTQPPHAGCQGAGAQRARGTLGEALGRTPARRVREIPWAPVASTTRRRAATDARLRGGCSASLCGATKERKRCVSRRRSSLRALRTRSRACEPAILISKSAGASASTPGAAAA